MGRSIADAGRSVRRIEQGATAARPGIRGAARQTFGSLDSRNYRLFFFGELVSHTGGWMHTMAEAWLVLSLTHDGTAVGATLGLRFLPVLLFGLWGGAVVDRHDRRRILIITQLVSTALTLGLWLLVLIGVVEVWMVFAVAFLTGCVTAVDQPAHHAFAEQMVGPERLSNAVALNSAVSNSARITGPALAGFVIAWVGTSWVFFINAVSFLAVVGALWAMRPADLLPMTPSSDRPRIRDGITYTWGIEEIRSTIVLMFVAGLLVYNFPTFLTILASDTFHGGAGLAGLLMAALGLGTLVGALAAAHRARQTSRTVLASGAGLGALLVVTAAMPTKDLVLLALLPTGAFAIFFASTANAHMQLWSAPRFRGRVMAVYTMLAMGTTIVGGPLMGWVSQRWSARAGLGAAGAATLGTAAVLAAVARRDRDVVAGPAILADAAQAAIEAT
jgi:MFS family permease